MFSNLKHDFRRYYHKTGYRGKWRKVFVALGSQGFQAVMGYRFCRWMVKHHIPILHFFIQRFVEITTGISIPADAAIGKGLLIMHFGGIVINSGAELGEFCTLGHGVTIGNKKPGGRSPRIGNNVYICAGAKVLGDITVGDNSIIGANAVLMDPVAADSIVAGMPAKVVKRIENREAYREFYYEG